MRDALEMSLAVMHCLGMPWPDGLEDVNDDEEEQGVRDTLLAPWFNMMTTAQRVQQSRSDGSP
jgi:hypothetical protein